MINFYFIIELPVSLSPRQGRIIIIINQSLTNVMHYVMLIIVYKEKRKENIQVDRSERVLMVSILILYLNYYLTTNP